MRPLPSSPRSPDPVPLVETRSPYGTESVVVDVPSLEAISVALPADRMRWDLAPLPPEKYVSDLELAQVAIARLADLRKRYENLQLTNRELRARQRTL